MKIKVGFNKKVHKYFLLTQQKRLIEKHYNFLKCHIEKEVLICKGEIQPLDCKHCYKIKIECVVGKEPKSSILNKEIEPCKEIHMYNDHSLCLHYSPDLYWNENIKIYQYTIPWIIEWIIFYELYLINGNKWEGRESPTHFKESDKNVNVDVD